MEAEQPTTAQDLQDACESKKYETLESEAELEDAPDESEDEEDDPYDMKFCARVKVRGTNRDEEIDTELRQWEEAIRADASVNGGIVPPESSGVSRRSAVRLMKGSPDLPAPADTETELNGLLAECRFLMHEVAFHSACLTYDPEDRIRYLSSAQSMALAAARIGKTVAQLRAATESPVREERRQRITVEHVQVSSRQGEGENAFLPETGKQ